MKYDVMGIGNALMDILLEVGDDTLAEFNLKKGEFHIMDSKKSKELMGMIAKQKISIRMVPGGSSANVLAALGMMGASVIFCGRVGKDEHGDIYEQKMVAGSVNARISRDTGMTGHAMTFITPDAERTFSVFLGASVMLQKEDILEDDIKSSAVLHVEGYQLEDKTLRSTVVHAMEIAKNNKVNISIDLGDPGVVRRHLADIRKLVAEYADIVFANELEAEAFTGVHKDIAVHEIAKLCGIAVVKLGPHGSMVKQGDDTAYVKAYPANVIDLTGAGDLYAAGFLFGLRKNYPLDRCARMGSFAASKIIAQVGARLEKSLKEEIGNIQ